MPKPIKPLLDCLKILSLNRLPSEAWLKLILQLKTSVLLSNWLKRSPVVDQLTAANGKTQLLLAIAQRYGELQQVDKALPILAQAIRVAQTIPGEESQVGRAGNDGLTVFEIDNDRGSLIEAIAIQYAYFKQPTQAVKAENLLQGKRTREQALQAVKCASSKA